MGCTPSSRSVTNATGDTLLTYRKWCRRAPHRHHAEGPAVVATSKEGDAFFTGYYWEGKLHRPHAEGPALVYQEPWFGGIIRTHVVYVEDSVMHRPSEAGPAHQIFTDSRDLVFEKFFEQGRKHRPPQLGPAVTFYCNSRLCQQEYWWHGALHRPPHQGPASLHYNGEGAVDFVEHWVHGKRLNEREMHLSWRLDLLRILLAAWRNKPCLKGLGAALALRRVCRTHGGSLTDGRLVEPFGRAVVAFL